MCCSRQAGKSTITAALAAWRSIFLSHRLVITLSKSERQSQELFRKITKAIVDSGYDNLLIERNKHSCEFYHGNRIVSLPCSEDTIRGYSGVTDLIIDEASRVPDALYYAVRPMLITTQGNLYLISTFYGKLGFFYEEYFGEGDWERYKVTADECPRFTRDFLDEERRTMPHSVFMREYYCEPMETDDQCFSYDEIYGAMDDDLEPLAIRESEWSIRF